MLFIGGIVVAFATPATVTWKPESETLASEKSLAVSARWNSESEVLADEESLSTSPLWQSDSDILVDEVITVGWYETYDYWWGYKPWIYEEAKDFVINGTAIEQSSPQLWFNLYVFDSINFDLWKAGKSYAAYFETQGKVSIGFGFEFTTEDEVPDTFYFVIEGYSLGVKPTVRVTATIGWIEKNAMYDYTDYFLAYGPFIFEEAVDFILNGSATETGGYNFNFCIMDSSNYYDWYDGEAYTAYYEVRGTSTITFSVPLTEDEATSSVYFVVENPNLDIDEVVDLSATINWIEKASIYDCSEYFTSWEFAFEEVKDFVLGGTATEVGGNRFNFYIFDSTNYFNWIGGEPYVSYYEVKNVTTKSFSIPLTEDEAESFIYFVAENPLVDTNETVKVSATLEWNEKATIGATVLGILLGGAIAFIGLTIMIIAGIAALVFKPKPPATTSS